jgi:transcriptional regulator with XRE-family HTH domain
MDVQQANLKKLREIANLSQEQLAQVIGLSQTQISRYEADPDNVPFGTLKKWVSACGTTLEEFEAFLAAKRAPLLEENPYEDLHASLNLLEQFIQEPPPLPEGIPELLVKPASLVDSIQDWRRRPAVLLAGKFDSGKTRIVNSLLGGGKLPSQYQPTTAIATFVRHQIDRPRWQEEDVWIMGPGFRAARWHDKDHCMAHRIVAGTYDTLKLYGIRRSTGETHGAIAALVYVDAPILLSCMIIDLPGYADTKVQAEIANSTLGLGDIIVYTSTASGFLDDQDVSHIAQLMRTMPRIHSAPLSNLYILATHANQSISDDDLKDLVGQGASRLHTHLKDGILADLAKAFDDRLVVEDVTKLSNRFFTFWYESESRREAFESDLSNSLKAGMPIEFKTRVDREIRETKKTSRAYYRKQIEAYEVTRDRIDEARQKLQDLEENEDERVRRLSQKVDELAVLFAKLRIDTNTFIENKITPLLDAPSIEKFIELNYKDDSDSAGKYARAKLLEDMQSKLERELQEQSKTVKIALERFLDDYQQGTVAWDEAGLGSLAVPFDAKGIFLGGIAGLGTIGALSFWAAGMGNLGAYILVAKAASLLTALGLGVGSSAAVTFVAAIGGPVTVAAVLFAGVMLGTKMLLGEKWERRLSKKISKQLLEMKYVSKLQDGAKTFWDDSEACFEKGLAGMEESYKEYRTSLTMLLSTEVGGEDSARKLTAILERLEELQDFFGALPWRYSP